MGPGVGTGVGAGVEAGLGGGVSGWRGALAVSIVSVILIVVVATGAQGPCYGAEPGTGGTSLWRLAAPVHVRRG